MNTIDIKRIPASPEIFHSRTGFFGLTAIDHPTAEVREHPRFGKGVFASAFIPAHTEIASFDGEIFYGEVNDDFPREVMNHLISFAHDRGRASIGIARYLNHSCSPNTGVRGLFRLVTMREVQKDEELCWDYDMSEDSDWWMPCECGSEICRKRIRGFRHLPDEIRERYRGFVSDWLVEKYGLERDYDGGSAAGTLRSRQWRAPKSRMI